MVGAQVLRLPDVREFELAYAPNQGGVFHHEGFRDFTGTLQAGQQLPANRWRDRGTHVEWALPIKEPVRGAHLERRPPATGRAAFLLVAYLPHLFVEPERGHMAGDAILRATDNTAWNGGSPKACRSMSVWVGYTPHRMAVVRVTDLGRYTEAALRSLSQTVMQQDAARTQCQA